MNEDENQPNLDDFISQVFGSAQAAEELSAALDQAAITEAWRELYKLYQGLLAGGFPRPVATEVISGYLYRLMVGMGLDSEGEGESN
jgi:hypothetical protein